MCPPQSPRCGSGGPSGSFRGMAGPPPHCRREPVSRHCVFIIDRLFYGDGSHKGVLFCPLLPWEGKCRMLKWLLRRFLRSFQRPLLVVPTLWILAVGAAGALPLEAPPDPLGAARIQYNQEFDDDLAAKFAQSLG